MATRHSEQVTLGLSKDGFYSYGNNHPIYLRRGETGLTSIDATILDNGVPYNLTGCSVMFLAYDVNKKVIYQSSTISNATQGKVSYTVTNTLTNAPGEVLLAYFRIASGSTQVTTQGIQIVVLENVDLTGEQAEEYTSQFEQLLESITDIQAEVNKFLNDVTTVTNNANQAASAANTAATNANSARANADAATSSANTAASNATTAANTANTARDAANKAAETANKAASDLESQWAFVKRDAEGAISNATTQANAASQAASKANAAADRVDGSINKAEEAVNKANDAADRVDQSIEDAQSAAGDATSAASASREATQRLNDAMDTFNTITGYEIAYAISDSSTVPPTDNWTAAQQETPEGKFQWVRTTTHFMKGSDQVAYSIAYQGKDGKDGLTTEINGMYWLGVEDGWLYVYFNDEDTPPDFTIDDGFLYRVYEVD